MKLRHRILMGRDKIVERVATAMDEFRFWKAKIYEAKAHEIVGHLVNGMARIWSQRVNQVQILLRGILPLLHTNLGHLVQNFLHSVPAGKTGSHP